MEFGYNLGSNSTPLVRKYQVGASFVAAGTLAKVAAGNGYGVIPTTTTACANALGLGLEAVTVLTAQQSDGSDPSRLVSVIINPDAVIKARCSGSSTVGTAITDYAETSGDTAGVTITAAGLVSADEGMVICSSGANAGAMRENITGSSGSAAVGVAFKNDIAIGDRFFTLPFSTLKANTVKLVATALTEVDQSAAVATNEVAYQPIEVKLPAAIGEILTDTYVMLVATDHLYASS
jgi:hypothetical protein